MRRKRMRREDQDSGSDGVEQHEKIARYIQSLHDTLNRLDQQVEAGSTAGLLHAAFRELATTVEQLGVAENVLRVQNGLLAACHQRTESERRRYQGLFDGAPDALLVTDAQGTIQEANRAAAGLLGLAPRFLRGKLLTSFIPVADRPAFRQTLLDPQTLLGPLALATGEDQEVTLHPRRGPDLSVGVTVAAAPASGGRSSSLRWVLRRVSRRRTAEVERVRLMVEGVNEYAMITVDPEGIVTTWNSGAERILGFRAGEIIGRPGNIIFTPEDRAAGIPEQEMRTAARAGRAEDDRWHLRKDGSRFWGSGVKTALYDGAGNLTAYAMVLRDLTVRHSEEVQMAQSLEAQRRIAQAFQQAVLQPVPEAVLPGLEVAALYEAAQQGAGLGGDFYDVFPLGEDRVALVVGDVTGYGLDAARRTAEAKFAARALLHRLRDPEQAVAAINDYLCAERSLSRPTDHGFVALAVAVVDAEGEATIVAAGSEPPLVLRADGTPVVVEETNVALGIVPAVPYRAARVRLAPEDCLLLVTDGLTEARNVERKFLDYRGLVALAQSHRSAAAVAAMGRAILDAARAFAGGPLADDACLVLARRLPNGAPGGQSASRPLN